MAKPRLVKVRALFYVLQQVMKRGCIGILIHPQSLDGDWIVRHEVVFCLTAND